jgi:hypothetical protein
MGPGRRDGREVNELDGRMSGTCPEPSETLGKYSEKPAGQPPVGPAATARGQCQHRLVSWIRGRVSSLPLPLMIVSLKRPTSLPSSKKAIFPLNPFLRPGFILAKPAFRDWRAARAARALIPLSTH